MAVQVLTICTVFLIGVAGTVYGACLQLPVIRNSGNNVSGIFVFRDDSAVKFHCLPEYRPEGNNIYKCSGGSWIGGPFSCSPRFCPPLGSPDHGKKIGDNYEVGAVVRFKCDIGYELAGSSTYQCQLNEKWQPPSVPKCHIKKCGTAPSVAHGIVTIDHTVNGQEDVYGVVLKVQCTGNFIRSGPAKMNCNKNGQWTEKPTCEHVSCPPYPGLDSECVLKSKLAAENTLLFLYCTENSSPKGSETASCVNNEWDDLSVGCLCDCAVKTTSDLVELENLKSNGMLTHGETLKWSCKQGSSNATSESLTCDNGAIGTPVCIPNTTDAENTELTVTGDMGETAIMASGNIVIITVVVAVAVVISIIAVIVARIYCRRRLSNTMTKSFEIDTDKKTGDCLLRREQENIDSQKKCFDEEDIEEKTKASLTGKEMLLTDETHAVNKFKKETKAELTETDERHCSAISNEFRDLSKSKDIDVIDSSHQQMDTITKERKAPGMTEYSNKGEGLSDGTEHLCKTGKQDLLSVQSLPSPSLPNNWTVLQCPGNAFYVTSVAPVSNGSKQECSIPGSFKDNTKNSQWHRSLPSKVENTKEQDRFISDFDPAYGTEIN